ncbi:MAG: hypothetical protein HC787_01445, partial [Nostocaceae cyanobacterium CSU_2_110]|nr:hypothetical protein [Nostocaceae cyanobacterium CSU_2_110]
MTTLFDIELYHQPEIQGYKSDWDGAFYDPAWDEPDGLPEILQNKVAVDEEVLEERKGKVGSDEISSDCWNSAHFGEVPRKFDEAGNPMVFWDESIEPPLPDDFESNHEYEQAWLCWEKENSDSLTYVAELEQGFPFGESSPEKSNYADCAKPTNGVEKYCSNASQMSLSMETCATSNLEREKSIALHH